MKAFACDEELLISGANLEQSYFTDRQDRYMYFGAAGDLAHYHLSLIHALGSMGARVTAKKSTSNAVTVTPAGPVSADEWSRRLKECTQLSQPRPVVYTTTTSEADTWVLPSLQCAPLGVHQDEEMTAELLKAVPDNSTLNLSTAYLNPTPPLIRALAEAAPTGRTNLLSAHPDSHGFKGARGLMAYVPLCYEHLLTQRVVPALRAARPGPSSCVNVLAYQRASWTFHAKGIWVFPKASENNVVSESEGAVTVVGSSNFGRRSSELDLECQMTILTESPELSAALKDEWSWLEERCAKPQDPVLEEGATTGSFGATSVMSSLMGKFL
jgi:CDP-diacylglycerol--glycerol-3-phosphate 3-phosphatidyltransferase